jgi:hypothetical protein
MIDFLSEEINVIEQHENSQSKSSLIALYSIYDKYNGTNHKGCWCGLAERKAKHKSFFAWYNENKNTTNDEQTTNR